MNIIIDGGTPVTVRKVEGILKYNAKSGVYTLKFEAAATTTLQKELGYPKADTKMWLLLPSK